jgi:predicted ester cyclase
VTEWESTTNLVGSHQDDLRGIAATGREIRVDIIHVFRVADGQIAERWGVDDTTELTRQNRVVTRACEIFAPVKHG